jgi:hypothetical protein
MWGALHATASLECRVPQNATESDTERQETANGLFQPCFNRGVFHESNREPLCRISGRSQPQPGTPRVIQTERGVGYIFALPVEPF